MRNHFPLLVVAAIVLVSGCSALPFSSISGAGVVIESFAPDFTNIFSGEPLTLRVKIRNTGSVPSSGGDVSILGLEEWSQREERCVFSNLLPAQSGINGESLICLFSFTAPNVPHDLPVTYHATARVAYTYSSSVVKSLTLASQKEMKRGGGKIPIDAVSATSGPVSITVSTNGPIRVFGKSVTFPLAITFTNAGNGVVCKRSHTTCTDSTQWNIISLITAIGNTKVSDCTRDITLSKGTSNTITCHVTVSELPQVGELQKTITVDATYGYFSDVTVPITVSKR